MSLALLRQQLADVIDGSRSATPGLSTGLKTLDAALPGAGLPRGRLTEMVGAPGSGKTTIVRTMVERAIATGWPVAYIDAARTLAPQDWAHAGAQLVNGEPGLWVVRPDRPARGPWCADVLLRSGAFAFVVLADGAMLDEKAAQEFVHSQLADYKVPRHFRVLPALPRNATGKVLKTALRELVTYMMEDPRSISRVLSVIWALRSLERIGDHARNISELVIYLVRGTDVRHMGLKRMTAEVQGRANAEGEIPNVPAEADDK